MNVKSMIVGLLIAVVASTGTYFLVPPPRDADAGIVGLSRDELWIIIMACAVNFEGKTFLIASYEKSTRFRSGILCLIRNSTRHVRGRH